MTVHTDVAQTIDGCVDKAKLKKVPNIRTSYSQHATAEFHGEAPTVLLVDATSVMYLAAFSNEGKFGDSEESINSLLPMVDRFWAAYDQLVYDNMDLNTVVLAFDTARPHNKQPKVRKNSEAPYDGRSWTLNPDDACARRLGSRCDRPVSADQLALESADRIRVAADWSTQEAPGGATPYAVHHLVRRVHATRRQ
jgi:hypothetical protein